MTKKLAVALAAISALGCGDGRYEIVGTAGQGCDAYRLDTRTGEVHCLAGPAIYPVQVIEVEPAK